MLRRTAITCAILACAAAAPARAAVETCAIRYPFGTVRLATSNYATHSYGADLRMLYGDWDWAQTFGLTTNTAKAEVYVRDVAQLVLDCVGDLSRGRLDFSRHQVVDATSHVLRPETDPEFYDRSFDDLVDVRRELATAELHYDELLAAHAPLVPAGPSPAVAALKTIVSNTVLRVLTRAADRSTGLGWIVVNMNQLDGALDRFLSAHALTRTLITVYLHQFPSLRDQVIQQMIDNVGGVIDQYGQFYTPERQAELQALLDAAAAETADPDLNQTIANLNEIADELQGEVQGVWDAGQPLLKIAIQLKLIFGNCDGAGGAQPQLLANYFGDLAVTNKILEEGGNGTVCSE